MIKERKRICVNQHDVDLLASMCARYEVITQKNLFFKTEEYFRYMLNDDTDIDIASTIFAKYNIPMEKHKIVLRSRYILQIKVKNMPAYGMAFMNKMKKEHACLISEQNASKRLFLQSVTAFMENGCAK